MNGYLVYNDSLTSQKFDEVHNLYVEGAKKIGITLELVKNTDIIVVFDRDKTTVRFLNTENEADFILFLDKDVKLARQLESLGYKIFNTSKAIEICDDKNYTHQELINNGVRIPKTITSKVVFKDHYNYSKEFNKEIIKEIGLPMVIKESFGSFGQQVYLVKTEEELIKLQEKIKFEPHLYQEFITSSSGKDLRIYICDNEYVTSMYRYSEVDFKANASNGGKIKVYEPTEEFIEMAKKATNAVGAYFAGVDLLFGENGEPIVCEVNSNAHIKNVFDITNVNVGDYILKFIKKTMENN